MQTCRVAPQIGHLYSVQRAEKLFAWLPAVPHGQANVRYKVGDVEHAPRHGYHDHNWGDVPMQTLMHNGIGACQRRSLHGHRILHHGTEATYETQIVYMLAREGKIIADDDTKVYFETDRVLSTARPASRWGCHALHLSRCRYLLCRVIRAEETILQAIFTDR